MSKTTAIKPSSAKSIFSLENLMRYSTLIAFAIVIILFAIASPLFLQMNNIVNILSNASMLMFVAVGLTFIVVIGGVDLSIAALYGITGLVSVSLMQAHVHWTVAVLAALIAAAVFGMINAFLVVRIKISVWLATLGTLFIGESIERIFTRGGAPIYLPKMDAGFQFFGRGSALLVVTESMGRIDVKFSFVFALLLGALAHFLLSRTNYGRMLYAIGTQKGAASLAGVPVARYMTIAFVLSSVFAGIAGLCGSSVLTAYVPVSGRYYLMDAIGAVFIGSTIDKRGFANIPGTLIGVLFFGILSNGLNLVGISFYWQAVSRGVLIFLILALDSYRINLMMKVKKNK